MEQRKTNVFRFTETTTTGLFACRSLSRQFIRYENHRYMLC